MNNHYVPFASTSRAILTLPFREQADLEPEDEHDQLIEATRLYQSRHELYQQAWNTCNHKINSTLSNLHDAAVEEILSFVKTSYSTSTSLLTCLTGRKSIRTGLLIGASPGSSSLLFSSLCRQLSSRDDDNPSQDPSIVTRISSRSFSNSKAAMRAIVSGLMGSAPIDEDEEGEEIVHASFIGRKPSLLAPDDMRNLTSWYSHRYGRRTPAERPNLVILLEDLESTDAAVLSTVLHTCSIHVQEIPIVFLIGVATSTSAIHNALPRSTTNLLETANLFVEPGIAAFNALMRGLFIDWDAPLSIGSNVYQLLLSNFEDAHHSIDATVSSLQYLYLRQFEKSFAHIILPPSEEDDDDEEYRDDSTLLQLAKIPSVAKSSTPGSTAVTSLRSDDPTLYLTTIEECRQKKMVWRKRMQSGFDLLILLQDHWSKKLPVEELILRQMNGKLSKHSDAICDLMVRSDAAKLNRFLKLVVPHLESKQDDDQLEISTSLLTSLREYRDSLQAMIDQPRATGRLNLFNNNLNAELGVVMTSADHEFSKLVRELTFTLRSFLTQAFQPSSDLLLHEVWFPNNANHLKPFHPSLLPSYHKSLTQTEAQVQAGEIESDTAIAYRLYRETGKLINLADWWNAFDQSATNEMSDGEGRERRRREDAEDGEDVEMAEGEEEGEEPSEQKRRKQARFLRAVGDLAHVGFLQSSSRKMEHVAKSVF